MNWPASSTASISQGAPAFRSGAIAGLISHVEVMIPACGRPPLTGESRRIMVL